MNKIKIGSQFKIKGMGGSKTKDYIENLMAMCRKCHHEADFGTQLPKDLQKEIHNKFMKK